MKNSKIRELNFLLGKWTNGQGLDEEEIRNMQKLLEGTLKYVLIMKQ
jgi:hypothetical protein